MNQQQDSVPVTLNNPCSKPFSFKKYILRAPQTELCSQYIGVVRQRSQREKSENLGE